MMQANRGRARHTAPVRSPESTGNIAFQGIPAHLRLGRRDVTASRRVASSVRVATRRDGRHVVPPGDETPRLTAGLALGRAYPHVYALLRALEGDPAGAR